MAIQLQQYLLDDVYCVIEFVIIKRLVFIARLQVSVCNDQFCEFHFLDNFKASKEVTIQNLNHKITSYL